jgi:hypothetical protein
MEPPETYFKVLLPMSHLMGEKPRIAAVSAFYENPYRWHTNARKMQPAHVYRLWRGSIEPLSKH